MSSVVISGDTSGTVTVAAPAVAGSNTLTLQAGTATNSMNTLATAVASTSGTSIDFTGLPSWVKRITVMLGGVSTSGTSATIIQLGSSTVTTSGYAGSCASGSNAASPSVLTPSNGFQIIAEVSGSATYVRQGIVMLTNISSNLWVASGTGSETVGGRFWVLGGTISLGGVLDRVRLTTSGGTDTFDAGTVNILYEG